MGIGGISVWQLLIVLALVLLIFGTKRVRNIGSDLGSALKGFRNSMKDDDDPVLEADPPQVDGVEPERKAERARRDAS